MPVRGSRRDAILSILSTKGPSYIKDISLVIREVSEKTIQRELAQLVLDGQVTKAGERRWTTYALSDV
jgi:DeoR/GlpR family transcriptional regulator of sugar metabolism